MRTFHSLRQVHYSLAAMFCISTAQGDVFMYVDGGWANDSERAVVEVDAKRFLALWRHPLSSHPEVAHRTPAEWRDDHKYASMDRAFRGSAERPLGLAEMGLGSRTAPCIGITDGVTRTLWLLTNGAMAFPIACLLSDAASIHAMAGTSGSYPLSVAQLVPRVKLAAWSKSGR